MAYIQWHQPAKKIVTWREWRRQKSKAGEYRIVRIIRANKYPSVTLVFEDEDYEVRVSVPHDIFKQLYPYIKKNNSVIYYVMKEDKSDGFLVKEESGFRYFKHDWGWKLIEVNTEDEIPF